MNDKSLILGLSIASLVAIFAACLLGSTNLSLPRMISVFFGTGSAGDEIVVWEIRMPRALAAFITGAGLAASGAALQGLLRNP